MEQLFNIKRFIKYARYQLTVQRKNTILILGASIVALFLFMLLILANEGLRREDDWLGVFIGTYIVAGLLLIGNAFPGMRNKKTSIQYLMTPASPYEKFVFEFVFKVVLFTVIYPFIFLVVARMSNSLIEYVWPTKANLLFSFDIFEDIKKDEEVFPILKWIYVFGASIAFAGASAFKRLPLVKTLIVFAIVLGAIAGYMYLMVEEMHLNNGLQYFVEDVLKLGGSELPVKLFGSLLGLSSLTMLAYAFFNLKEREV